MKTAAFLTFAAGAATASLCFLLWSAMQTPDPNKSPTHKFLNIGLTEENQKLTERVKNLEKQVAVVKQKAADGGERAEEGKPQVMTAHHFDESKMEEMMKQHAEREVNRETDKLALRLKLTPEQKESLRKFLLAQKESERAMFRTALKDGGQVEAKPAGQSKEDFLKGLLSPEQQTEYARSQEDQRKARAEDYAQRKVRKLNDQLSLSEEQKDGLFQAYAQKKLVETDPAKAPAGDNVVKAATHGAIAFSAGAAEGGVEPIEFDFDVGEVMNPGSGDLDRATLEGILTPEQLAVYDQRKAEEKAQGNGFFHVEGLPDATGGAVRIEVNKTVEEVPAPK